MFKLLVTFIIVGFALLLAWAVLNLLKPFFVPKEQPMPTPSIDALIETLKKRIDDAELDSANGIVDAEQRLEDYKKQLARAQELKSKTSNL